ncbi:MAG: helix-turn-helix domain-containing protein [Candidatus Acidulodesulfobacterium sp.]
MENEDSYYETVGEYLKASRKSCGLETAEIAKTTKINASYIEAIENDDFSMFSSPQLLKGYIKLLAKTVKADEKKAVSLLESELKTNFTGKVVEDIVGEKFKEEIKKSQNFRRKFLFILIGGILIILLSYVSLKIYRYINTLRASETHSISIASKKKQNNNIKKSQKKYGVLLKAKIVKKTWVAVKIDKKSTKTSMLYPKESKTWKADKRLRIKIGNAGGIILNYNGKNIGKPGKEGQVITLFFPPKEKK